MISEELTASLVTALMQEAEIDLNKEVEQYAKASEYDSEDCKASAEMACELDVPFAEDNPDLQSDVSYALTDALLLFFQSLPESTQEEIKQGIRRFASCPDKTKLMRWNKGFPISPKEIQERWRKVS